MGHLEQLARRHREENYRRRDEPHYARRYREQIMREIRELWEEHKTSMACLSDVRLEDNGLEMLVHYLIQRDVL